MPYSAVYHTWNEDPYGGGWHEWKANYRLDQIMWRMLKPVPSRTSTSSARPIRTARAGSKARCDTAESMLEDISG